MRSARAGKPHLIEDPVTITPYRDGPLLVRGPVKLRAADGTPITCDRDPIALCRCGRSALKPFCDGTHKLVGFRAPGGPGASAPGGPAPGGPAPGGPGAPDPQV